MNPIPTYILAGGQSKRFGSDKARAMCHGEPMISRVCALMAPFSSSITAVGARTGQYDDLGVCTIGDLRPGRGPLGGMETALADALEKGQNEPILVVCCDLVVIEPHWIEKLVQSVHAKTSAVVYRRSAHSARPFHPFPGLYRPSLRTSVSAALDADTSALQDWLSAIDACALTTPADWPAAIQANTPDELSTFEGHATR